ncbi:hypothetical protein ACFPLB_01930 [Aquamicrobium segne]|uniref:Uncharacterized protein n=1 Tax=Aquamicrobium segne TaxID=469547 RepID=A0ABW0GW34_9HYPH
MSLTGDAMSHTILPGNHPVGLRGLFRIGDRQPARRTAPPDNEKISR